MKELLSKLSIRATLLAILISTPFLLNANPRGLQYHYQKGVELYEKEKYTAAQVEFRKAAEVAGPDDGTELMRIDYYTALCASELKEPNAEEILVGFIDTYPESIYNNDIRFALASTLHEKGEYRSAYEQFTAIRSFDLGYARLDEYNFKTGYSAYMTGDTDKAYSYFKSVTFDPQYIPHATYYIAYIDYTRGNLSEAKRGFSAIADNPAYEPLVPFYLLQIEFSEGNYAYVIEHGIPLMAKATTTRQAEIARIVSEAYFHERQYADVLRYMDQYQQLGGTMGREELYLAGYSNYRQGNYEKAVEQLRQVAGSNDELSQNASYHLGDAYLRIGDKPHALSAFAQAAAGTENRAIREDAMFNYGKLQYELGDRAFNEAITILNNFITEFPNSPKVDEAREYLLAAYFNSRNYEAAYDAIKQIKDPDNNVKTALQKITYYRALDYFEEGDYGKALEFFDISNVNLFNAKYSALTKYWMAETSMRLGNYNQAIPLLENYIRVSPASEREHKIAHYNLGYSYFNQKKWSEAYSRFSKFLNLYPTRDVMRADAQNRMGDIRMAQREYSQAIEMYDQAIQTGTKAEADYARYQRALMLGFANQNNQKIESLRQIAANQQSEYADDALFELGKTYVQHDRFSEGANAYRQLISDYPRSPYYLSALSELGLVYQNLGNQNEALKYYKMVVEEFPNSPQARDVMLGIRNIYVDQNDIDSYAAFARESGIETNVTVVERDSLTYAAANRVYQSGAYNRTLPLMKSYLQEFPRGAYRTDALYALGDVSLRAGDRPAALAAFLEVGGMPGSQYKSPALQQAGRILLADKEYEKAANIYRELAATATHGPIVVEALSGYLRSVVAIENHETILTAADELTASPFVTEDLKREATFAKAQALHALHRDSEALPLYREIAKNRTRDGAEARYRVIAILYDQGEYKTAEKEVFDFAEQNTSHQYWMGRAFLILGDVYVKLDDTFQAKATYQSIIDGYADKTDGVIAEAEEKLKALAQ